MANWAGTNSPSTRLPVLLVSVLIELRIEVLITCLKLSAKGCVPSKKQNDAAKAIDMFLKGDFLEEPLAFYLKGVLPPLMIKLIVLRGNRHFTTWN